MTGRNDMGDAFAYMLTARRTVFGVDEANGDDEACEVDAVTHDGGRLEILAIRHKPRNSAGVATMARLMQRTREERDFGGAVDDE